MTMKMLAHEHKSAVTVKCRAPFVQDPHQIIFNKSFSCQNHHELVFLFSVIYTKRVLESHGWHYYNPVYVP